MTTHYDPRWPHVERTHPPDEGDALRFPRFVRREYVWDEEWRCYTLELRYNPDDRLAAVFVYEVRDAAG